jgi:hypothetical protein
MMTARWSITNSALFRGAAAHFGKELRHKPPGSSALFLFVMLSL